ncbi:PAQR family membrane homeostasis protein TrhA [Aquirhabdus parva]|uniref:Hemolysin III family protein n=1 Tax=Aquirhabdus parva TaxID=2283318 RepID=A0A345P5C0_9GAMM|nr:hemolysin III family protein [Aquirhabdus parva]AXI02479.1 hemolysin III family protein [Aquirhabdus parva]
MQTEPSSPEISSISEQEKPFEPHYPYEEVANSVSHGLGMLAAIVASVFMLMKATAPTAHLSDGQVAGVAVYGASMILLFLSSTLYHSAVDPARKAMFNRLDHCAIYLLIAGSYTPFLMITLKTTLADVLLIIIWALAVAGIAFKIFFIDKFPRTSLATYLMMGWLSIIAIYQLYQVAQMPLVYLLIAGGVSYSVGTIFYAINKIPYNHAIWHIFVLVGAALHCFAIWQFVIP